ALTPGGRYTSRLRTYDRNRLSAINSPRSVNVCIAQAKYCIPENNGCYYQGYRQYEKTRVP
ncbi:hypothetical protein P4V64_31575, partial [Bacillus thuringiensis]|nr:hypothetical protein [Bacillus thuringiensis]